MHAVGTLEGVIGSVRAGGGIAVLPRSYLELAPGARDLSLFDLPEKFRSVEIYLIVQRWKFPMRLVDSFVQSCLGAEAPEGGGFEELNAWVSVWSAGGALLAIDCGRRPSPHRASLCVESGAS